ncbi:MAG TPA: ATP-binding protein [Myxococcaceae bacterium]
MDAASKPALVGEELERSRKALSTLTSMGPTVTNVLLVIWYWGQWSVVLTLAIAVVCVTPVNVWLVEVLARRYGRPRAEVVRMMANVAGLWISGHCTQWSPLVWGFVPYNLIGIYLYTVDRWMWARSITYLVLVEGFALWEGAPPDEAAAFGGLGLFGYLLTARRLSLQNQVVAEAEQQRQELEQAHQQLQHAHERALAQEKLSSLGMMAAGVAHEINNPMSFVTSNLSLLLKDLKQQPSLPEPLKEYVDEVLPETLEGIKRVNAIVGDLRRFSRGDLEASAEYDLNAEVAAALRIAHAKLAHCQVEQELGEVGLLMGRPQQIVQVLVNMLVNAGQATARGGRVRVSTHREADGARVEIRDTGPGLTPEARRHLFQPFFTTRPHGTGMGLGLAVAHGIVTAHGGRIEVDSQPGQGTCFMVHLPRTPPQPVHPRSAEADGSPVLA